MQRLQQRLGNLAMSSEPSRISRVASLRMPLVVSCVCVAVSCVAVSCVAMSSEPSGISRVASLGLPPVLSCVCCLTRSHSSCSLLCLAVSDSVLQCLVSCSGLKYVALSCSVFERAVSGSVLWCAVSCRAVQSCSLLHAVCCIALCAAVLCVGDVTDA